MISERPALRFSPLLSAMERLTTASPAGLIQIKGARSVRRTTSAIPAYVNLPRRPPARSCATPRKHRSRPPEQQDAIRCGHRPKQIPALDWPHVAVAERGVVHKGEVPAPNYRSGSRAASRVNSGDVPPKQPRLGLRAALQLSDRHMSRLPTRGHRPYLQRRHLRPLRLPPHAAFVVVQRPRRSLESTAALPSPARFQSTAKDRYWVTMLPIREFRTRKPRRPKTPA